jgi:NADPH-dependent F420 reductase
MAKAQAAAQRVRDLLPDAAVEGTLNSEAVAAAGIVILTVPPETRIAALESVRDSFRPGAILVDTTVVLKPFPGAAVPESVAHVPEGVAVVTAFQTLSAKLLADLDRAVDSDVFVCGDNFEAKSAVRELVAMLPGARAVDGGALANTRLVEALTALLISLNVRRKAKHAGVRVTGLEPGF